MTYKELVKSELRKKRALTPEEFLQKQEIKLKIEIDHWADIMQNGCYDPFWTDGVNMNLTRNHILYYKNMILATCDVCGLTIPATYYLPTPPEVDDRYMAKIKPTEFQRRRRERLKGTTEFVWDIPKADRMQLTLL